MRTLDSIIAKLKSIVEDNIIGDITTCGIALRRRWVRGDYSIRRDTSDDEEDTDLVMVLKQLDDDFDVGVVVLDGDDTHDVGSVLSVWILTVLVGQHKTCIGLFHLTMTTRKSVA